MVTNVISGLTGLILFWSKWPISTFEYVKKKSPGASFLLSFATSPDLALCYFLLILTCFFGLRVCFLRDKRCIVCVTWFTAFFYLGTSGYAIRDVTKSWRNEQAERISTGSALPPLASIWDEHAASPGSFPREFRMLWNVLEAMVQSPSISQWDVRKESWASWASRAGISQCPWKHYG